ncbi:MAG TPA: hypothetical protein DDY39_03845 [Nitrospira sp.]|nr:hypothetical protein [Nitrospira sp.]
MCEQNSARIGLELLHRRNFGFVHVGLLVQTHAGILTKGWFEENLYGGDPAKVNFLTWHFIFLTMRARMDNDGT